MSKDEKPTIILPVETVEMWIKTLAFINNSLIFWKFDNKWPTNLIIDAINEIKDEMNDYFEIIRENG